MEGEAGIGKTAVLRAFAATVNAGHPVYWGACEAMTAPRPLGALDDIAIASSGRLVARLDASGDRHRLFVAFVDLLAEQPALVVIEDLHWADEATLDLLRYAGRRIAGTRSLLVASFRNDELTPSHPLRSVLGDLATSGAARLVPQAYRVHSTKRATWPPGRDRLACMSRAARLPGWKDATRTLAATLKPTSRRPCPRSKC